MLVTPSAAPLEDQQKKVHYSKGTPIWPAIAIVVGLGLIAFATGLSGYLKIGALKDLSFRTSVILMGVVHAQVHLF